MGLVQFVSRALVHPKRVGTIIPNQGILAERMAREVRGESVAEFGSCTGQITRHLLRHLPEDGKLYCFEIDREFCERLSRIRDPRMNVFNDFAQNLYEHVPERPVDCVVSSLPLALMNRKEKEAILKVAAKSPLFIQMQYSTMMKDMLEDYFDSVTIKFAPNFPPAWYYVCRNEL